MTDFFKCAGELSDTRNHKAFTIFFCLGSFFFRYPKYDKDSANEIETSILVFILSSLIFGWYCYKKMNKQLS